MTKKKFTPKNRTDVEICCETLVRALNEMGIVKMSVTEEWDANVSQQGSVSIKITGFPKAGDGGYGRFSYHGEE